jgi:hypothetical protein
MFTGSFKSIRTKLTVWFLLVSIVPIGTAITIVYFQRVQVIKKNQFIKLEAIRDLKVAQINQWFQEREGDLRTIAGDQIIPKIC